MEETNQKEKPIEQWTVEEVVQWALKIDNSINQEDAKILHNQRINGKSLLMQTKEDLRAYGIPGGPASILAKEIENLKGLTQPGPVKPKNEVISFIWKKSVSSSVQVYGSWDNWNIGIPLYKIDGHWKKDILLPLGIHQFKYYVDGNWEVDMEQKVTKNGNNINNVITVQGIPTFLFI